MTDSASRDPHDGNEPHPNDPLRVGAGLIGGEPGHERSVTSSNKVEQDAAAHESDSAPSKPGPGLAHPGLGIHVME